MFSKNVKKKKIWLGKNVISTGIYVTYDMVYIYKHILYIIKVALRKYFFPGRNTKNFSSASFVYIIL